MTAARSASRYGHLDATMILIGYRHGLRASELCDLQWSQVELNTGRLHVRRAKGGSPSALRRLQREQGPSPHVSRLSATWPAARRRSTCLGSIKSAKRASVVAVIWHLQERMPYGLFVPGVP
jgi:integrase